MTGAVQPVMLVHGEPYYWDGMATMIPNGLGGNVYVGNQTGLPEGYIQQGELELVWLEEPTENLQMMADFEASGTVYTSKETPEAVYVHMTTDWFSEKYVRFVCETLAEPAISYRGKLYQNRIAYISPEGELPVGFEMAGTVQMIDMDHLPQEELEVNGPAGDPRMEDGEIYASEADDSVIYLFVTSRPEAGWPDGGYYPCYVE